MAVRATYVALLLSTLPVAGCGTVTNLAMSRPEDGGKSPFGGVRQDVCCMKMAANGEFAFKAHPNPESGRQAQVALTLFYAADLPFSLIGDVVTWPYTASYSFINQPIPTPPVTQAVAEWPPQPYFAPDNNAPEKKTPETGAEQGKQRDDKPAQLPMSLPQGRKQTP